MSRHRSCRLTVALDLPNRFWHRFAVNVLPQGDPDTCAPVPSETNVSLNYNRVATIIAVVLLVVMVATVAARPGACMWDFRAYCHATAEYATGGNPYAAGSIDGSGFPYVYPPVTLCLFMPFLSFDYYSAYLLFLALKVLTLCALLYLWWSRFVRGTFGPFALFGLFAFNACIGLDLFSGNMSVFEQALIWLALAAFLKKRLWTFCALIVAASMFKLTPIVFLALLFTDNTPGRLVRIAASLAVFGGVHVVSWLIAPDLCMGFLANMRYLDERGIVNPSTLALCRDVTQAAGLPMIGAVSKGNIIALVMYAVAVATFAGLSLAAFRRLTRLGDIEGQRLGLFLLCVLCALAMPRWKDYAYMLLIVPAYCLIVEEQRADGRLILILLFMLPSHPFHPLGRFAVGGLAMALFWSYYPLVLATGLWALCLRRINHLATGTT